MPEWEALTTRSFAPRSPSRSSTRRAIVPGRVYELEDKDPRWRQNCSNAIGDQRLT
ncbi:hypothetical protein BN406_04311 (plasmid) [Sinorhizobium meliloti Rm41]|nr:hypothetical protein BN406_04311 [Sinorhizobium meliloti Rm41]